MAFAWFLGSALGALYRERRYTAEKMQRAQTTRLRAMLFHAKRTVPLYTERLSGLDVEREPDLLGALSQVAPVGKPELMERFDETISARALTRPQVEAYTADRQAVGRLMNGRFLLATTSGTTGKPGFFVTDAKAWAQLNGALFARILRHRLIPSEILRFAWGRRYRMAMLAATDGHFITRLVATFKPWLSYPFINMKTFSIMGPLPQTIEGLNRFAPHYLHSYTTYLESLAHAKLAGRLSIDPEFISLGSEPVSQAARAILHKAFPSAELSETYGATECIAMANQCKQGGLHINDDYCVLEPVDEQGHPVPPGTPSAKVLLTNLVNRAQPLIRYELGDSVTVLDEPCPCGAAMPLIRVEGRSDDTFFLTDAAGRYHAYPPVPFETLFLNVEGLSQYQLVHEQQNLLNVRFVPAEGADPGEIAQVLKARFLDYFKRNQLEGCVELKMSPVAQIEREARGHKLRQMYNKVPRPELAMC